MLVRLVPSGSGVDASSRRACAGALASRQWLWCWLGCMGLDCLQGSKGLLTMWLGDEHLLTIHTALLQVQDRTSLTASPRRCPAPASQLRPSSASCRQSARCCCRGSTNWMLPSVTCPTSFQQLSRRCTEKSIDRGFFTLYFACYQTYVLSPTNHSSHPSSLPTFSLLVLAVPLI